MRWMNADKTIELMTKREIKQILKDNSKSLGDTTVIYETWYDEVVEDIMNLANSSNDIQNVSSGTSELKKAVSEKLKKYKGMIGSPDYPHRIEQNACECLVRELTYLDDIVEYES